MMLIPGRQWKQRPPARGYGWGVNGMLVFEVVQDSLEFSMCYFYYFASLG